jgi:hypothetical protein
VLAFSTASPTPDTATAGSLRWEDLTGAPPTGFGQALAPDGAFEITVEFEVIRDITSTVNLGRVDEAEDEYGNVIPPVEDEDEIVDLPTWIDLLYFRAAAQGADAVLVTWATAVEIDNFGFRLLRATSNDVTRASEIVFVPSQCAGNQCAAEYSYLDQTITPGRDYWYWLVDVDTDGLETRHGPVRPSVGVDDGAGAEIKVFLPLVMRNR